MRMEVVVVAEVWCGGGSGDVAQWWWLWPKWLKKFKNRGGERDRRYSPGRIW